MIKHVTEHLAINLSAFLRDHCIYTDKEYFILVNANFALHYFSDEPEPFQCIPRGINNVEEVVTRAREVIYNIHALTKKEKDRLFYQFRCYVSSYVTAYWETRFVEHDEWKQEFSLRRENEK